MKTLLLIWNIVGVNTHYYLIKDNDKNIEKLLSCHNKFANDTELKNDDFVWALSYLTNKDLLNYLGKETTEELALFGLTNKDIGKYIPYEIKVEDLLSINQHIDHIVTSGIY